MDIFNKVALQGLKKNRTRTLVTVIGVALSAALITVVATFAASLQNYMINGAAKRYGDWHVCFPAVNSAFIEEQADNDNVVSLVYYENIGYAVLEGGVNPDKPYLFAAGLNLEAIDTLPINLLSGRMPENSNEVLVPAHVASNGGVKIAVGDTLTLAVGRRLSGGEALNQHDPYSYEDEVLAQTGEKTYTVVGICGRPAFEERSAPGYTLITVTDDRAEAANSLSAFVELANPMQARSYTKRIGEGAEYVLNNDVLRFMGVSGDKTFNTMLYSLGAILILLIMVGSVFLIYNSFNISLSERMHQFGILMSVGATEKQLRNSVLFEGLCIGTIGIPVGIIAGIPTVKLILSRVEANFANVLYDGIPLTLNVSAPALIAAAIISLVTILVSAYIPAGKAVKTPVMECIRRTNEIKADAREIRTSGLTKRIYGLEGMLASKNFKRNKRRYRSIVLSLTFSVVLFVSVSTFGNYLNQMADNATVDIDGDIIFYAKDMQEDEFSLLYEDLKAVNGVSDSTYQAVATFFCEVEAGRLTTEFWDEYCESTGTDIASKTAELKLDIQFLEDDIYKDFAEGLGMPMAEYDGEDAKMLVVGKLNAETDLFNDRSMDFTISGNAGGQSVTIHTTCVDSFPLDPLPVEAGEVKGYTFMVVAPYGMKPQFDMLGAPTKLGVFARSDKPGPTVSAMRAVIDGRAVSGDYALYNMKEVLEQNKNLAFVINLFSAVFIAMITLIAVANVFNTISTNIRLRRRELAMLRSIGMSDRAFNKMMRYECVFYGAKTMLWGLPLSIGSCLLIYAAVAAGSITGRGISFVLPLGSLGISMLGVFIIIFITMVYAASKIKRENIIDALRDDMA